MKKEMLINCLQPEEIRIAILEDGILEELYVERASHESYVGNIYKGRIVNIEPSIQAAFVDFGVGRNGFLHVSDVEPAYYRDLEQQQSQRGGGGDRDRGRGGRGGSGGGGGRGRGARPQSRDYDDYDRPRRGPGGAGGGGGGGGYRQPPTEHSVEDDTRQIPVVSPEYAEEQSRPQLPPSVEDGPDIIVEEIVTDDDFYDQPMSEPDDSPPSPLEGEGSGMRDSEAMEPAFYEEPPPVAELPREPQSLFDDVPQTVEPPRERVFGEGIEIDEPTPPAEPVHAGEEATGEDDPADDKTAKKGRRKPTAKAPRAKKPRKSTKKDNPDEPKPRPMDSSERRTDEHDPSLGPIEPRPASPSDISDEELSFSMAPRSESQAPAPKPQPRPEPRYEAPIVEPLAPVGEHIEEPLDEPIEPPMSRFEDDETLVEIVEEEKMMEAEAEEAESAEAPQIVDEGGPPMDLDEEDFGDLPPPGGRGRDDRGRGRGRDDRGRDDRGRGGDRGDRGGRGRDDRGRGGSGGGRDRGRGGFDRDRGRGPGAGLGRPKPHIEDIFKRGQEVLVKVIKEGIGTKGPTLTTYISIAGRYLVLMPGLERIGVSRKIEDDETRRRLREILRELKPPRGIGFIIRTAGQDRNQKELQSDLAYLSRLWQVVVSRIKKQKSPCEIYRESDMVTRTIRDNFTSDIDTIWVDERGAYDAAKEFMQAVMPRYADRIKFYDGTEPMFHKYGIEQEIARIQMRHVPLPHGGSIVIDQTEALVAIDVNSGNFRSNNQNAEDTAFQMNLHAAKEIARQLRLRDLGGVIANDFIDMREDRHRRGVEKALRDAVQRDRARTKILRISQFGIIEMTRQRIRPSLKRSVYQDCKHCHGTGHVKTGESVSIDVMRMLQLAVHREVIQRIEIRVHDEVAQYLQNRKRKDIVALEESGSKNVTIHSAGAAVSPEHLEFLCFDNNGNEVKFANADEPPPRPARRR